ncbi:MAG TPA: glycerate kinase [Bacteroidota bacterium]|nr:glycerate kinase [Bacteroidota bacterium]
MLDVAVLLTGKDGPSLLFSPQKGATANEARKMESGFKNIIRVLEQQHKRSWSRKKLRAGGGVSLGLMLLSKVSIIRSKDFLCKQLRLTDAIQYTDLVITAEGKYDRQSELDKATGIVLRQANRCKKKVFFIAGLIDPEYRMKSHYDMTIIELRQYFDSAAASLKQYKRGLHRGVETIILNLSIKR